MTDEKKVLLQKMKKRIDVCNKFRLAFLFFAVVVLVCIYFGNKFWENNAVFLSFRSNALLITGWDVIFMVISTFLKFFFTVQYNKVVKQP